MGPLNEQQLKALSHYKHSGIDNSFLTKYYLDPVALFVQKLVPHWISPNMVRLSLPLRATYTPLFCRLHW